LFIHVPVPESRNIDKYTRVPLSMVLHELSFCQGADKELTLYFMTTLRYTGKCTLTLDYFRSQI